MRIPLGWIAEYVDLVSAKPEDVLAALVRVGLEEEDIHRATVTGPVVVGQVLDRVAEPQMNGKTINWCHVQVAAEGERAADGGDAVRGIVCGAHNFEVGDKVVVTLPGAVLPGDFAISARKTYGHISDGMMASARELGMGEDHTGIIVLSRLGCDPQVGADARALLGLDEEAVEINVTPDRGYCFSIRGVAREYAHSTGARFTDPASLPQIVDGSGFPVSVEDTAPIRGNAAVRSFVTRVVEGVDATRPTPPWMAQRLRLAGMRSISVVVDITNYVMLELGHPLHAYDKDRVSGGLTVRRAGAGEKLATLDGQERVLDPEDLVIADDSGAIGLAGVMGGLATEVSAETHSVLIEAAVFDPISIARSARRHKLPSEASKRYERGVDPLISRAAAARVVELLEKYAGGRATSLGSVRPVVWDAPQIVMDAGFPEKLVGVPYAQDQVVSILQQIGAAVHVSGASLTVEPPSWRPDLNVAVDLVEEVARISGYDRIPSRLPVAPPGRGLTFVQRARRRVSDVLAASGMTEVWSYPFFSASQNAQFAQSQDAAARQVKLANALDAKAPFLRRDILPGLLEVAKRNLSRGLTDLAIFERGSVFRPTGEEALVDPLPVGAARPSDDVLASLFASIPDQPLHLAAVFTGWAVPKQPGVRAERVDWRHAVECAAQVAHALGVAATIRQTEAAGFHPGRAGEIVITGAGGEPVSVGVAGALHPDIVADYDLHGEVAAVELDLDQLIAVAPRRPLAHAIGTMPAATQDLSLVVPVETTAAELRDVVREGAGSLLEHIAVVDDYRGEGIPQGCKSITFALRFRAPDRTLTAAEASDARDAAIALAAERLGATVRI